jgi:hypothetical protein
MQPRHSFSSSKRDFNNIMEFRINRRESIEDIESYLSETLRIEIFHQMVVPLAFDLSNKLKEFRENFSPKGLLELIESSKNL